MDTFDEAIARVLDAERIKRGRIDHKTLEARTGIPVRSLYRYLNGERAIPMSKFVAIAEAIGVDPGYVIQSAMEVIGPGEQQLRVSTRGA